LKPPSKPSVLKPPSSKSSVLKPPSSKPSVLKPPSVPEKIKKKLKRDVDVTNITVQNFEKSKYSKEDIIELFKSIHDIETIEELREKVEEFIENDNDNSYVSEILMYIIETFSMAEIKFIISLFLKTEIKTLGLFFEKFLKNKENIINVAKFTKFANNLSIEDFDYKKKILEFGEKNANFESILKELVSSFDKDLIFSFIYGFSKQGTYLFDAYFDYFVRENKVRIRELEKEMKKQKELKQQQLLEKSKEFYKIKQQQVFNEKFQVCKKYYTELPWISNNSIIKTFIRNASNGDNTIMFDELIDISSKIQYRNESWYEVNDKYYELLCNDKIIKENNNVDFIFKDSEGKMLITLRILFCDKYNEYFIQDDIVFANEKTFFANLNIDLNDFSVQNILNEKISSETLNFGKTFYKNALEKISDTKKYNDINYILNDDVITNRDLAIILGNVIVFLDIDTLCDSIFKKRVQKEFYNYNVLFHLSKYEKLPELLINDDIYQTFVSGYIDQKIQEFIYKFAESIYILRSGFTKTYNRKQFDESKPSIEYNSIKTVCDIYSNYLAEELVLYKNNNKIQCFYLKDTIKKINNDSSDFSNSFINHLKRIYDFSSVLNVSSNKDFPLVSEMVTQILSFDDTLIRYEVEKSLGIYDINAELLIKENENIEENVIEYEDDEGEEEELPENV
jgi:hypothetical protein